MTISTHLIQDWTSSDVPMKYGASQSVQYKVYKQSVQYKVYKKGTRLYQEIRDIDDREIHTLELPQGIALEKSSYEVLLRYVLVDVVNS